MTAETLKPFISTPSSEHFSPEDPATKRQTTSNIITLGLNITCAAFAVVILVFMIWSSLRIFQLEAEVKSVTNLVESMKRKLGLDYLDDLTDLEFSNGLIDDPRTLDDDNENSGTLLNSVLDNSDPVDYDDDDDDDDGDDDDEDDILSGANDTYEDDDEDDDDIENDKNNKRKQNNDDDISTAYPDDSETDSYENDGDNLYDDFEKYKDAKKLRKTRSIDSDPIGLSMYKESYAQRKNKSGSLDDGFIGNQLSYESKTPTLRYDWNEKVTLEHSSVKPPQNIKENHKRHTSAKNVDKKIHQRNHLSRMRLHNRKIRAMLKSGTKSGRPEAIQTTSVLRLVGSHYFLNNTISGKHVLHPSHNTLPHDGDVYIGAPHAWVKQLGMDKFFHTNYGVLIVQERGLYLIYAQIYYDNRYDRNGFVIYHNTHPFLICSAFIPTNINKSHTCYTSGLIYLQQNDEIHLRDIHRDRVVSLTNAKSFFGLVKIDGMI